MRVSVFGLGYVGVVCSACLARIGHQVIGVDINVRKVEFINRGKAPVIEPGLGDLLSHAKAEGMLRATAEAGEALMNTELSLVCVGTPSQASGELNLDYVRQVLQQIGDILRSKDDPHIVVMRSTVLPGTARRIGIPVLEAASGKAVGKGFGYVSNPEFLREGSAIADFFDPPKTVIGESGHVSGDAVSALYKGIDAPLIRTRIETAEMVKYADNAWHAVKVAFANEIGNLAKAVGVDGHEVMDIFCRDTKLNISANYLKPGFAFGGSCLPKDVRALSYMADQIDIRTPLLRSIMKSNFYQIDRAFDMILASGAQRIALLGLSFKATTDDVRESPQLNLLERLIGRDFDVGIYDRNVSRSLQTSATSEQFKARYPHVLRLLGTDLDAVIERAQLIVVGNASEEFMGIDERVGADQMVIDLVRISERASGGTYQGICW